ncbi:LCP family protein [Aeromicrobium sp. CF3.5]|uniref:LCP family protein n=1 Tax=Aeromicrobium sp. CF3.5 TaxID=3373078 RepID=UPI003EE47DCA
MSDVADATARIQFRRGLTLTLMTLVMPGSAQLVTGNKKVGRIAVRIWLGVLALGAVLLLVSMVSRRGLFVLATNSTLLHLGTWLLIAGAIAWVVLMLDAWRLAQPLRMERSHRLWMTGLNSVLCFVTAGTMLFAAHLVSTGNSMIGTVFASESSEGPADGRYNVLLLGGDSGPDRNGARPDSLTVASVDADTGRTVLVGLPRNLQDIPFPKGTVMHEQFPDGFDSCEGDCYLNSVNTWANDHADLFPASYGERPGLLATMDAVEAITGLDLAYYAMVDMSGFSQLVDAVGGVTVDVKERTAIDGIGRPVSGYIEAGTQKLTGDQALWYSRSRVDNDDFSRMGRQKCVMNAMLQQLNPKDVLLNIQKIADSSKSLLDTNIPGGTLGEFMDLALKAKSQKVSTVSLVPPAVYTGNPDYDKVHSMISSAVDKAEGKKAPPQAGLRAAELKVPDVGGEAKDPRKDNQSSDLSGTC